MVFKKNLLVFGIFLALGSCVAHASFFQVAGKQSVQQQLLKLQKDLEVDRKNDELWLEHNRLSAVTPQILSKDTLISTKKTFMLTKDEVEQILLKLEATVIDDTDFDVGEQSFLIEEVDNFISSVCRTLRQAKDIVDFRSQLITRMHVLQILRDGLIEASTYLVGTN